MAPRYRSAPMRGPDPLEGILLVDKPAGPTSHDVVDAVRDLFRVAKAGHGGTLDPAATGLLILLLGHATRVSQQIMSTDKVYEGLLELGVTTDSHDADGEVLERRDPSGVTAEALATAMAVWHGDVHQQPPMVSAIKKDGVPLYKLARKGQDVAREPRLLHIFRFDLLDFRPPLASFRVHCSKGTYVRTLCHDVGHALGCGGMLRALRRTASGSLRVENAIPLEQLLDLSREQLAEHMIPLRNLQLGLPP